MTFATAQQTYEIVLAALREYEPRKLIQGQLMDERGGRCALGVASPEIIFSATHQCIAFPAGGFYLDNSTVNEIENVNDLGGPDDEEPAGRYTRVVTWLEERVNAAV